ncbi:MAG: hypothetical protein GF375_00665 [Candidatus Omnitrophica bacterium]|nr:hypothetical protein [Candidatus Omnitrophota bacterium]MBD3268671.1 hypothetical protein [Candidatus Omnitrophota bacterium]
MRKKEILYKVVSFIDRKELDFLDKISKDIYFSTGKKIPRSQIIEYIIHISRNHNDLEKTIMESI